MMPGPLKRLYRRWLARRLPPARQIVLSQKRVFIFPTGYGFLYLLVAALLFVGGINYENNLILSLSFLLASLFMVAILHTFMNFSGLGLRNGTSESGFSGGSGALQVILFADQRTHHSVRLSWPGQSAQQVHVIKGEECAVWLNLSLPHRGRIAAPRIRVESRYPLGLLCAWSYVTLDHYCLAWPRPVASDHCPADGGEHQHSVASSGQGGNEEFQGLREYTPGDSLRKVDWKGYARGRGLYTKVFAEPAGGRLWLRWSLVEGLPEEQRLSVLCYWTLALDKEQAPYGLELPGLTLAPDSGDVHRWRVLDALACYPEFD
ncbi:hypothetical protein A11A3_06550 [Alcanivorax hongdengensis A-11-3]|uniref:Uncharacterized protein n=1 Tax=Alcanivorax hongdengensis A-11-3 TaxID=1177179 RepID=L0WD39_9GAMM|nr:DUF58 domain-containing protein [Alcanivorax hongdengensis]EKF74871.1 hypothetical protein A11A3_06550 [Alcanivorax hongdengensis A-11-3]